MILETIIGALVPVAAEGVKGAVNKFFGGGVKPTTIEDQVKLDASEIEKLKAIAGLDNPGGTPSQWVIDLRASARYVAAGVVILGAIVAMFTPSVDPSTKATALEGANVVFGFLFGSRIVAGWKK
jgi:hypothetical protein